MRLPVDVSTDAKVRAVVSWATRHGMAYAAGSVPIGWYQAHHGYVWAILEARAARYGLGLAGRVRVSRGFVEWRPDCDGPRGSWYCLGTPDEIFQEADRRGR